MTFIQQLNPTTSLNPGDTLTVTESLTGVLDVGMFSQPFRWGVRQGRHTLFISSSDNPATMKIQVSYDAVKWFDLLNAAGNPITVAVTSAQPTAVDAGKISSEYVRAICTVAGSGPATITLYWGLGTNV